eukprot:Pompholyxophrys_sp_v1_NODE_4_length_15125_cov_6.573656.p4 type:complete len:254 gc:universal NODE_4_length_15125_cov_6.573656:9504-10265(+)
MGGQQGIWIEYCIDQIHTFRDMTSYTNKINGTHISTIKKSYIDLDDNNIKNFIGALEYLLDNDKYKEIEEYVANLFKNENENELIKVDKLMYKMGWPKKVDHYNVIYDMLCGENDVLSTVHGLKVTRDNVCAFVYYIPEDVVNNYELKEPTMWFKHYAPTIGSKQDYYHLFSFSLDKYLPKIKCFETSTSDPTSPRHLSHYMYFPGELIINDCIVKGCYEYFISSRCFIGIPSIDDHSMFNYIIYIFRINDTF